MEIKEADIRNVAGTVAKIEGEIAKYMVGQKDMIRQVILCVLTGGNLLLEGVPGLGKTRLVKTLGKVLDLRFSRIQFTPDLMPADVCGTNIISRSEGEGVYKFQPGPVFSNIVLADEINRATPKTQSALLEAMQEQTVTVGGITYELPQPFFVMATQNPIEMEGTYPLPEAQLDRFMFKLNVPFPSFQELMDIATLTVVETEAGLDRVSNGEEICGLRQIIREIPVARPVLEYAAKLVLASHPDSEFAPAASRKFIRFGSSPRGLQAILNAARVRAVLDGRYNVAYEDIRYVAYPALRHRIFLNFEGISEGMGTDVMIGEIIKELGKK